MKDLLDKIFPTLSDELIIVISLIIGLLVTASLILFLVKKIFPKTKFEKGPARETVAVPKRGLRNLSERMFAGLAQPIKNIINAANPKGSMCLNGLKLNRLCILAVSSPNRYAASACARS